MLMLILVILVLIFGWINVISMIFGWPKRETGIFSEDERPSSPQRYILALIWILFNFITLSILRINI